MKILAIEREVAGVSPEALAPHLAAEAARAWELYRSGVFRELYFRSDQHAAVIVLECEDADAARCILATLPLVSEGLIGFEVMPLEAYTGFARLFGPALS